MSGKDQQTPTVHVNMDKVAEIFDSKIDEIGRRFEDKLRNLSAPRTNPTLSSGGGTTIATADGNTTPSSSAPRGPGYFGKRPEISPDDAKHTLDGFRALLQGDKSGCMRAWKEIDGYERATLMQSDEHTAGGVLVPEGFLAQVITELPNFTPFADPGIVRTLPMEQPVVRVPRVGTKPAAPGVIQEAAAYPETEAVLGHVELVARKIGEIIPITEELIAGSSIAMFEFLAELVAEQMADKRTSLLTNGVGTDEPQGVRLEGDITTYPQAGAGLAGDDIVEIYYSIKSAYRRTAIWMLHDSIAKAVRKLKDGNGRYLWVDGGGFNVAQPTLMGRPVYENPEIPTNLGSGTDESEIIFGSWRSGYWLGIMSGLAMSTDSSGTDWKKDIVNLKFRERYDGKVADPAAFVRGTGIIE